MYHVLRRTRRLVVLGVGVAVVAVLAPFSAFSADTGTVNAQVVAGVAPCILITSPPSGGTVDFGNLAFSTAAGVEASGTPDITVSSCTSSDQSLLASGTNATAAGASWTLVSVTPFSCATAGIDVYRLGLRTGAADLFLAQGNQAVGSLAGAGSLITRTPRITMPCTGSSGNGATMTMSYNFTATIP